MHTLPDGLLTGSPCLTLRDWPSWEVYIQHILFGHTDPFHITLWHLGLPTTTYDSAVFCQNTFRFQSATNQLTHDIMNVICLNLMYITHVLSLWQHEYFSTLRLSAKHSDSSQTRQPPMHDPNLQHSISNSINTRTVCKLSNSIIRHTTSASIWHCYLRQLSHRASGTAWWANAASHSDMLVPECKDNTMQLSWKIWNWISTIPKCLNGWSWKFVRIIMSWTSIGNTNTQLYPISHHFIVITEY